MGFAIPVTVRLIPGQNSFTLLLDAEDRLRDYGWTSVSMDSGPAGKITTVEDRQVTYFLDGKTGATDGTASDDVQAALKNVGVWEHVLDHVGAVVANVPVALASKAGEAAGAAASGAVKSAGAPLSAVIGGAVIVTILVGIGVAVFVAKRG